MSNIFLFFRIHTGDIAFLTKKPRGLFAAISKLVESKTMNDLEIEEYWKNKHWFESNLPVPPFYKDGNTIKAITWFKNENNGIKMFMAMTFYFSMARKYGISLYITRSSILPGNVIYEDIFQIGVVESKHDGPGFLTEKFVE